MTTYERTTTASRRNARQVDYLHVSCEARMVDDPRTLKDGIKRPQIPYVEKGTTHDVHRNKRKEMTRDLARRARA